MDEKEKAEQEIVEKKPKKIGVIVVSLSGKTALVQWMEGKRRKRGYIPSDKIENGKVGEDIIEMAKPYSVPFADLVEMKVTPQQLEDKLYDNGIWTVEDLTANSKFVPGILQSVYAVDMAALFKAARKFEN